MQYLEVILPKIDVSYPRDLSMGYWKYRYTIFDWSLNLEKSQEVTILFFDRNSFRSLQCLCLQKLRITGKSLNIGFCRLKIEAS